ncbi:hypothetical protein Hanom_Chr06g00479291 [Helianthus anomalus]
MVDPNDDDDDEDDDNAFISGPQHSTLLNSLTFEREKMLLLICIFEGTLFIPYNFLIYFESDCE